MKQSQVTQETWRCGTVMPELTARCYTRLLKAPHRGQSIQALSGGDASGDTASGLSG
jgi:hypothetical protein